MLSIQEEAQVTGLPENVVWALRAANEAARRWATAQIAALTADGPDGEVQYGSPEWVALPVADRRRNVALLRAAEAWRSHSAGLAERVVWQIEADVAAGELAREEHRAEWDTQQAEEWQLIARWARGLASVPTTDERLAARAAVQPRAVRADAGWPPVAIPGRPGWWRHLIDGQQVDLPSRDRTGVAA